MKHQCAPAVGLFVAILSSSLAFAQATPATPTQPAKALPTTGWAKPLKGTVTVDVIRGGTKKVGNEVVTTLQVKNTSNGPIALLKVDEYWYDKKNAVVSGDSQAVRKPIQAGEIVEVTCRSPFNPEAFQNQYMFSHANGQVKATVVKKFKKASAPRARRR
jgi:hypothetical protein